jgi:hypothetical protein
MTLPISTLWLSASSIFSITGRRLPVPSNGSSRVRTLGDSSRDSAPQVEKNTLANL